MKANSVLTGSIFVAAALLCCYSEGGPPQPAKQVLVLPAQVEAFEQTSIHARIAGHVQKVRVDIGDRVRQGDTLAQLAVPELDAELRVKEAKLKHADEEIELAKRSTQVAEAALAMSEAQVQEAEAGSLRARANYGLRKVSHDRVEKLFLNRAIEAKLLEESKHQLEAAKAGVAEAEAKLRSAKAAFDGGKARRQMVQAEVQVATARREVARAELERVDTMRQFATLRAPFAGVVSQANAESGALVMPGGGKKGEPLFVLVRVDMVRVVAQVPEAWAPRVKVDTPVVVRLFKRKPIEAKIVRLSPVLDPKTRTRRVEIDLPNPDGSLLPGMSAELVIGAAGPVDEPRDQPQPKGGKGARQKGDGPILYVIQPLDGMDAKQMKDVIYNYYEYHFVFIQGVRKVESTYGVKGAVTRIQVEPGADASEVMAETMAYVKRSRPFLPPGIAPASVLRLEKVSAPGLDFSVWLPVGKCVR